MKINVPVVMMLEEVAAILHQGSGAPNRPDEAHQRQTLHYSFATHLRQHGPDFRTVQQRLGHKDLAMTIIDTHFLHQER